MTPLAAASLVAISRTMDYRRKHLDFFSLMQTNYSCLPRFIDHWHDVVAGSILGLIVSYFCYRQFYPSLGSALAHRPYAPRIISEEGRLHRPSSSDQLHVHGRDETHGDDTVSPREDVELGGTVRRDGPGPLEEVWREGAGVTEEEHALGDVSKV